VCSSGGSQKADQSQGQVQQSSETACAQQHIGEDWHQGGKKSRQTHLAEGELHSLTWGLTAAMQAAESRPAKERVRAPALRGLSRAEPSVLQGTIRCWMPQCCLPAPEWLGLDGTLDARCFNLEPRPSLFALLTLCVGAQQHPSIGTDCQGQAFVSEGYCQWPLYLALISHIDRSPRTGPMCACLLWLSSANHRCTCTSTAKMTLRPYWCCSRTCLSQLAYNCIAED
jgi:hypothetical protein